MYLIMFTYNELKFSVKNKLTKAVYPDLATATDIKVQFKENLSEAPIISKNLAGGDIIINSPATGDITVRIKNTDFTSGMTTGDKLIGVEITDASARPVNVDCLYNGILLETIEFKQRRVS